MPRRAAPGDEAAILAALSPSLRAALFELRELLDLDDWQATAAGPLFQAAGAMLKAIEFARQGVAPTTALNLAADHLGLERDTVASRVRRWSEGSRHYAQALRRRHPSDLVEAGAEAETPHQKGAA